MVSCNFSKKVLTVSVFAEKIKKVATYHTIISMSLSFQSHHFLYHNFIFRCSLVICLTYNFLLLTTKNSTKTRSNPSHQSSRKTRINFINACYLTLCQSFKSTLSIPCITIQIQVCYTNINKSSNSVSIMANHLAQYHEKSLFKSEFSVQ